MKAQGVERADGGPVRGPSRTLRGTFRQLGFPDALIEGPRYSIADLFLGRKIRRGLYCLFFADGWMYIGLSNDVVKRYAGHRRKWGDISAMTFLPVQRDPLDPLETGLIRRAEALGFRLRNFDKIQDVVAPTDLDVTVAPSDQQRWLGRPYTCARAEIRDHSVDRLSIFADQRVRYQDRFLVLSEHNEFDQLRRLLETFVTTCIPGFLRTEQAFWCASCLPNTKGHPRLAVINVNRMEVLVNGRYLDEPERSWVFLNVSRAELIRGFGTIGAFQRVFPSVWTRQIDYAAAGEDQICIAIDSVTDRPFAAMTRVLRHPAVRRAACTLVTRLMRKGGTLYARSHCPQLIEAALGLTCTASTSPKAVQ
ncbi:MAG TPA: hypothetical protein VF017_07320 [Thermoanaerobaculia bacterium]|nr:hypothetical protein [Thermoanaerobaculia bacterium]